MGVRNLIVLNNPSHWRFSISEAEVVSARTYLTDPAYAALKNARVFNLCRSYRYQSIGYYVSLLAAARDHRAIPEVSTMQDFRSQTIIRTIAEDIDELIQRSLPRSDLKEFTLLIYFGQTIRSEYRELGRHLYQLFQAPLLKVVFERGRKWLIQQIVPLSLNGVPEEDQQHLAEMAGQYFSRKHFRQSRIQQYAYDLAILVDPYEKNPPSCKRALNKLCSVAQKHGVYTELITKDDYSRLSEFDALFIRTTTAVNHYSYRFARKAYAEGLVVIDDPWSILRCANKVYLAERMALSRIPTPATRILSRESLKNGELEKADISFPCVLKQPDSAFSLGVVKVGHMAELRTKLDELLNKSDLVIAQEYLPSEFDWRIGVLDRQPLFACRYHMAHGHWQICNWDGHPSRRFGKVDTLAVHDVPRDVLNMALRAANLIGNGLYGVDLKQVDGRVFVIEVNDNPNIDSGLEDRELKNELYSKLICSFLTRIDGSRKIMS